MCDDNDAIHEGCWKNNEKSNPTLHKCAANLHGKREPHPCLPTRRFLTFFLHYIVVKHTRKQIAALLYVKIYKKKMVSIIGGLYTGITFGFERSHAAPAVN